MEKLAEWISNHQFPCITKQLFGFNCPFCGFQRSLIALLKGDICESVALFPALIPLALTIIVFGCGRIFNVPSLKKLTVWMLIGDACLLLINCIFQNILLLL